MGKQRSNSGVYEPLSPAENDDGNLDRVRLREAEARDRKASADARAKYLSKYDKDPLSQALAAAEYEDQKQEAQKAQRKAEYDKVVSKYDDPLSRSLAIAEHYSKQLEAPEAQKAFADNERVQRLKEEEANSRKLDNAGMGFAPLRETIGAAAQTTRKLASVVARVGEGIGLIPEKAADELNRESQSFGQASELSRQGDMLPYLSKMYGGAAESMMQMYATPGGAASKMIGAGVSTANDALTTAEDAGLEGAERLRFAGTQGLLESGIAFLGQKIFGPGFEARAAGQSVAANSWKQLGLDALKEGAKEVPEELVTTVLQDLSNKFQGVSPNLSVEDFIANAIDTVVQTGIMGGLMGAKSAAGKLLSGRGKKPPQLEQETLYPFLNQEEDQQAGTPTIDLKSLENNGYGNGPKDLLPLMDPATLATATGSAEPPNLQVAGSPDAPKPITPEELAFIENPSRKKYEAAVKAGMPESPNGMARDRRLKYAEERRQRLNQDLVAPPDPAPLEPAPQEAPGTVPDVDEELFLRELNGGITNGQESNVQGQQVQLQGNAQAGEDGTRQEGQEGQGLLSNPVRMQEDAPPVEANESISPVVHTRETFEAEFRQNLEAMNQFSPTDPEQDVYRQRLEDLYDSNPEWAKEITNTPSPVGGTGDVQPDQSLPPATDPASSNSLPATERLAEAFKSKPIGRGGNAAAYEIAGEDLVLRVPHSVKTIDDSFEPVKDKLPGIAVGQAVFKNKDGVEVLQKQKGVPAGLAIPSKDRAADLKEFASKIKLAGSMPQSAFDTFAKTLRKVNESDHQFDPSKSNNVLIDQEGKTFNLVDVNPKGNSKYQSGLEDMLVPLMGNTFAYRYVDALKSGNATEDLKGPWAAIFRKAERAAKKAGLDTTLGSSGRYAKEFAGIDSADKSPKQIPEGAKKPAQPGNSLRSIVLSNGGISAKQLQKDYNQKDLKGNGLLTVMRIKGQPLDMMAQLLESSGDLRTPADRNPADWLMEQLLANADGAKASYSDKEIEAQLNKEREEYEKLKELLKAEDIDTSGLEELRQNSIEAGFNEEGEIGDEQAQELIDISFDFGANVAARVGDIVEFTDRNGETKVGLVTKIRANGELTIEPELRKDNVGRPTSTRYDGAEWRKPSDVKKVGTSPFPATLNQFYSKWEGQSEPEIQASFTELWDSLDADDKGRLAGRLRKFGINAKVNNATDKLAAAVAERLVNSREIPGKIREIYDIAMEYPNLQGSLSDPETETAYNEMIVRMDSVGLTLPPMVRAAMVLPEMRRELLYDLAKTQFGEDIANTLFEGTDEDFKLEQPKKPKAKAEDFGTNENTKQGGLFDAGKPGELPGQNLLFDSDPGDVGNPKTQANKPKAKEAAAESQEDPRAALREQLREAMAAETKRKADEKAAKEAKPKTPRTPKSQTVPRPKSQAKETAEQRTQKAREKKERAAEAIRAKLRSMGRAPNMIVIPTDLVKLVADYAIASMDLGISTFREFVVDFKDTFGEKNARELSAAVEEAWGLLPDFGHKVDPAGNVADVLGPEQTATESAETGKLPPARDLVDSLETELLEKRGIEAKRLWELADKAYGGTRAEGKYGPSEAYDALETAINLTILDARAMGLKTPAGQVSPEVALKNLQDMQKQIVSQTNRSGTKDTMQQFSTPPAYSYVVSQFVNMDARDVVLEPSAGTGDLAVHALNQRAKVHVNELDPKRAEMLKAVQESAEDRLTISTEDAMQLGNIMGPNLRPSVVLMNPPFSREGQRMGDKKMSGNDRNHIDAAMASLIDGGRLVAIIGAGLHGPSKGFTTWLAETAKKHNVRANIEVSRDVYKGYGTTFPTRVLVIDKGTPTPKDGTLTAQADSLEHLLTMTKGIRNDRNRGQIQPVAPGQNVPINAGQNEGGQQSKVPDRTPTAASDSGQPNGNASKRPAKAPKPASGTGGNIVADDTRGRADNADSQGTRSQPSGSSKPISTATTDATGEPTGNLAGQSPEPRRVAEKRTEIDESVLFEPYQPSIVPFPNAKPHPTAAVESAAMAAVEYPEVTEVPNIDASIIDDGRLSDVQLEFVALAAHAHNQILPNEERTGILFGDGTGMGKGRGIPGVILHNWNEGRRKAIWMSKNGKLHSDAMREWEELGGNPAQVANLSDMPVDNAIDLDEGILFATYDTLKSSGKSGKTRESQVTDWLPADFDGVIAFDEAHLMGSDTAARAGVARQIQDKFPKARIVYASATAATEIDQLMFGSRLGLWGAATPFATAKEFAAKIGAAGVSAMESVALSLKAMGRYVSRSISFNDGTPDGTVGYKRLNHTLADHQVQMYDRLADAWQKVIGEFEDAMDATKADNQARGFARGQFWSAHQRFFNDLVTSLQMPTVIESIEKDLAEGRSVVIQLTTTGAAQQARALAGRGTQSLDDFAVDPFSSLVELVRSQFPTQAYENYMKDDGSIGKRRVVDSEGKPVKDAAAVAKQQQLLSDLADMEQSMPDSPIDMILNYFGTENVAEVTGRNQRVVWQEQQDGTKKRVLEKRSQKKSNQADIDAFQEGKKRILIFSQAGGTGASYHADRRARNQEKRMHYLVQPGWVAADAIQGLGRTHRTNQKQAPEYILVQTDIPGQKRFISTIARRLTQLGALTRGQRTAGGSGVFDASDNLESTEAALALTEFFKSLEKEDAVMSLDEFEAQTGLELRLPSTGAMKADGNLPDITSFMNRMLSMQVASQNKVFDEFDRMLKTITEARRLSGELDQGVETIKGSNIRKTRDEVVFTHDSGAKTRYVQLTMEVPIPSKDFDTQAKAEKYKDFIGYYKRKSDGKVFFVNESFSKTSKSGQVVEMIRLVPPYGEALREEAYKLNQGTLEKIQPADAEQLWNEQFSNRPKTKSQKVDMITGAVLPVWDRLPQQQPKLSRALTASGDMVLGVVLPPSKVNETLGKLGAEKNKVDVGSTIKMLREGKGDIQLVNGWKIQRVRVQNEWRLEIVGPNPVSEIVFQRQGVITERIGFKARYFIPFGENTQSVFDAVTRGNPIQNVNRYDAMDAGDEEESDTAEPTGTATPDPETGPSELRAAADKAKAELEAIREINAQDDKIINREWKNLGPATFAPLTPELLNALGRRIVGAIKAGAKSFEVVIREMRANIADDAMIGLKPNLIRAWNALQSKYDLEPATEERFDAAMSNDADVQKVIEAATGEQNRQVAGSPSTPTADPATPAAATMPAEQTIGINKAKRAERRDQLGLEQEDIVSKIGHSFPELDADAKMVSPGEAEDVFTRIGTGGEAADNASDRDVFVMLNHVGKKQMATQETLIELEAARAEGNDLRVSELEALLNIQVAEEVRLMDIAKSAGTAAGRALAAFKALLNQDMSLARLRMRLDAAADGKPTDAQIREQNALYAKYEAVLKELEAKTKEAEEAIARAEISERIAAEMQEMTKPGKTKADRRLEAAWKPFQKAEMFFSVTGALQLLPEFTELAGAYIEKGVETFSDFVERLTNKFGRQPKPETVPILQQAWDAAWDREKNPKPPEVSIEPDHPESLVNAAKALFRYFLSQGMTDTDQIIQAVHDELQNQFPDEVREPLDTMKAMVDYNKTRTISQDPLDVLAADKRAVIQMRVHLENMRRGIAPNRIEQRYPVTDEQRQHRKMVNEAKRRGGFVVTDPERQASTALAALETRLRHSISDTLNEIASGVRAVPEKTVGPKSDTTEDLQAYLTLIRGMHKDIFGDRTMTQEQKLKAAEAAAVKNEAYWNDRLARAKAGDFSTGKTKPNPVTNAQIDAIKARSALAKAQVQELKELAKPKPDPEAIADARFLAGLERQLAAKLARIADITARAAAGDLSPERNISKEKREANEKRRKSNASIRDARIKLDETTREMNDHIEQVRKKNLTYVDLAKRVPGAAWATLRDLKLTGELSFILRQGAPRVFGALVPAGKLARAAVESMKGNDDVAQLKRKQAVQGYKQLGRTLGRTLKAAFWKTDTQLARSMDELKQRPNYVNGTYDAMKLSLHEDGGKYTVAEELFINNLVELAGLALDKRFDGFKGFRDSNPMFTKVAHNLNLANRISNATKVFMNEMRADIADDAVALLTMKSGEMTPAEARSLGSALNALTGKGDMNAIGMGGEKAQNVLNKIMISAPWLMSRLQVLTLHPFWSKGSTAESRKAAAEQYVDMAAGLAAFYGLVALSAMFMDDDDEEKPVVEWDSTSSDYMKVRIGKTRLDPMFGLQQIIVLASRVLHDEIKDSRGVVRPRKGFEDDWALISRFQEGRLHPAIQDIRALKTGEDFMGQPITKTEVLKGMVMPITYPAIDKAAKGRGITAQTAIALWAIAGGGLSTYDPRTKERVDVSKELQTIQKKISNPNTPADVRKSLKSEADSMLEGHLVNAVKYDAENKVLADQVESYKPGTQISPELTKAVQKEKYDIALRAIEKLSTEDKTKETVDDPGITAARDLIKEIAPTFEDANILFTEAYRQRHGNPRELVGPEGKKRWQTKPSVAASRARLRAMYQD